jgi:TIR domain
MSVFVSYSHDSKERVVQLVSQLRADGVHVLFDRDMLPGGPNEGWLQWSEAQARGADKILMVCSERYCARYEGTERPGTGCGAVLEGRAIRQNLHDAGGDNPNYRVVVLSDADDAHVPLSLKTYHRFKAYIGTDYDDLLAWLGAKPAPTIPWERKIADCTDIFEAFERAVAGKSHQRILLISGPSGHGKTVVVSELLAYARHLGVSSVLVDFKGCPSLDEVFGSLRLDLRFLKRAGNAQETIADLLHVEEPLLLVFDTYEQSSEDAQKWLESQFLNRLDRAPKVVVVVGGQRVPDHTRHVWSNLAKPLPLKPIDDPSHWMEYAERRWQYPLSQQVAESLTTVTGGNPAQLSVFVEKLALKAKV